MASFPSIRIEGGLLGPETLDSIVAGELPGQKPSHFGLGAKRGMTDEIASVFADARALWGVFQHRLERVPEGDPATSVTRDSWIIPFMGLLGHELRFNQKAHEIDRQTYAISHRAGEAEDSPPVHIVGARQELGRVPTSGRPRLAPHSLVQEYLNRTEILWGIVTNGFTLRLLRNSTFVRRQAYVEFDLSALFEEQRFADFMALFRLLHRTRFPLGASDASECLLEQYYAHALEQGGRVREHLRDGVEECIQILGNGFLSHPANEELRERIKARRLGPEKYYRELLKIIYRFLFLLVSEDRGLLSSDSLYVNHYSVARLRRMAEQRSAYTDHEDLWLSLRLLWRLLRQDDPVQQLEGKPYASLLGLPVLNGELFDQLRVDDCRLTNSVLLEGFWHLAFYRESSSSPPQKVNYAALDVEELGSVYESLLEFHPAVDPDASGRLRFELVPGSERKTTGSYYTSPDLVGELVESAVLPVIENRLAASKALDKPQGGTQHQQKALLSIRVIDPACGSGHMLLAASRRIGKELARLRTGEEEPAPERIREAVRDVISHCVYGVDKNPLAVDLCRVALWLESHTTGKPLTFLDHRIRCGDALVGVFNLNALSEGIPDGAFKPLEGDDKGTAREYAKRNRDEQRGERTMSFSTDGILQPLTRQSRRVDEIPDDSPELIRRKKQLFDAGRSDSQWLRQNQACDLWTSAFFQPLRPSSPVITTGAVFDSLEGRRNHQLDGLAMSLSHRHRFFHWPLEFPEVFEAGGFDVVLSNPPWERVKLQELEFFAARDPRIANAPNKAARARMIKELPETNPELHRGFLEALRGASATSSFLRHSGRCPLTGRGDINTYAVFAETCRGLLDPKGRAGLVLPSGIATDDTTKFFFQDVMRQGSLASLYDFENRKKIFPAIDSRMKFCLFTLRGTEDGARDKATQFVFFALATEDLRKTEKRFTLTPEEIALLNPNTGNCPIFRTRADAELTKAIYRRVPVLWKEASNGQPEENPWNLNFVRLFDMANDSHHFRTAKELEKEGYRLEGNVFVSNYDRYLPLYEAKMLHQFDHRWATYEDAETSRGVTESEKQDPSFVVQPRYWVREEVVESAAPQYPEPVAMALQTGHRQSLQRILLYWLAGYNLSRGEEKLADNVFLKAIRYDLDAKVTKYLPPGEARDHAAGLQQMFPLTEADAKAIMAQIDRPDDFARSLVKRHSPKWFMGWRDICRSTDERTLIASAVSRTAIGNKIPLLISSAPLNTRLALAASLNSFISDFSSRQKIGGITLNYFIMKQISVLPPQHYSTIAPFAENKSLRNWIIPRVLELLYTAHDLAPVARDCGYDGPPFRWDPERRFQIRCELDAAFFHLYLGTTEDWQKEPAALKQHFPTPRDAVAYILETFPIVREKDLKRYGTYRTKDRILEIYDAMAEAMRTGRPYQTALDPPPGKN